MVDELTQKLRQALQAGRFEAALPLIDEYGKATMQAMRAARDDRARTNILNEASSFLKDQLHLARVLRSHLTTQLAANSRLMFYEGTPRTKNTWQFDA